MDVHIDLYLCACLSTCLTVCLFMYVSVHLSVCLPACLHVCSCACLPACLSASVLVCLSACLPVCLSACLPVCLCACPPLCLSVCLCACQRTIEAWLRAEAEEARQLRKKAREGGAEAKEDSVSGGTRVVGDPVHTASRLLNNGWGGGRMNPTVKLTDEELKLFRLSSNSVLRA